MASKWISKPLTRGVSLPPSHVVCGCIGKPPFACNCEPETRMVTP